MNDEPWHVCLDKLAAHMPTLLNDEHPVRDGFYWYTMNSDLNYLGHYDGPDHGGVVALHGRDPLELLGYVCIMADKTKATPLIDMAVKKNPDVLKYLHAHAKRED